MSSPLSDWPPVISDEQLQSLTLLATTYALSHGLLYLPVTDSPPPAPTSAIHAPLALFPSPVPRSLFESVKTLQRIYNVLYARIALDEAFLDRVMGEIEGAGKVDDFTGQLWRGWKQLRDEGLSQPLQLGIFRSDYMLHAPQSSNDPISLKQVEFNTISSSFGALSERASGLHNYLQAATGYFNSSPYLKAQNLPPNTTTAAIVEGLVAAHHAYGVKVARILFVVQAGERNIFDQRWLDYELLEKHSIHIVRQTFDELSSTAHVDDSSRKLHVTTSLLTQGVEISTIYFRAGYTPRDFPSQAQYATRMLLERSHAIKCPSLALQLAGGKKVQQVLTNPGVLESFLLDPARGPARFAQRDADAVRASWVAMWGLDEHGGVDRARARAAGLVLKPQREGGGNNVYKAAIPPFLDALPARECEAWIAMELIVPPAGLHNWLVRAGGAAEGPVKTEVVSELGIFGWALFSAPGGEVRENEGGWLVRTKGTDSDEGGVAVGFSVLDSILLVEE